jgi:hypothetical protein
MVVRRRSCYHMHSKDHVELEVASARGKQSSPVESRGGDVGGKC